MKNTAPRVSWMKYKVPDGSEQAERPVAPLSGKEYAALQALFSLRGGLDSTKEVLAKRAEMAGVTAEMEQLRTLAKTVMDEMLRTVPDNKLQSVMANLNNTHVYIRVEAPGIPTKQTPQMLLVKATSLDYVLNAMIDNYCLMCDKTEKEGRKCPHRQAMEDCLPNTVSVARGSEKCKFSDLAIGLDELD